MDLSFISAQTKEKLNVLVPDWEEMVDEQLLSEVEGIGTNREISFLRKLIIKKRRLVYEQNRRQFELVFSELNGKSDDEIEEKLKELSNFSHLNTEGLVAFEDNLLEVISDGLDHLKNAKEVEESIQQSLAFLKEESVEKVKESNMFLDKSFDLLLRKFPKLSNSKNFFSSQLLKFKKENERASKARVDFFEKKFFKDFTKAVKSGILLIDNMPEPLKKELQEGIKQVIGFELKKQQDLRRETIDETIKQLTGISGTEEIKKFLKSFEKFFEIDNEKSPWRFLGCEILYTVEAIIEGGFFDISAAVKGPDGEDLEVKEKFYNIGSKLTQFRIITEEQHLKIKKHFDNPVYNFCNGGWWAAFAHIGTLGFCSGFTFRSNLDAYLDGVEFLNLDWGGLLNIADAVLFFWSLPSATLWKTIWSISKSILKGTVKKVIDQYSGDILKAIESSKCNVRQ